MYATSLQIEAFKCFGHAKLKFQYPGRTGKNLPPLKNVNLILGDNGGGKSSILRAIAIAILAPTLGESGFVPYRLVRRTKASETKRQAWLKVEYLADGFPRNAQRFELAARLDMRVSNQPDRLTPDNPNLNPHAQLLFEASSSFPLVIGYGATRRLEVGDYTESSARRARGPAMRALRACLKITSLCVRCKSGSNGCKRTTRQPMPLHLKNSTKC